MRCRTTGIVLIEGRPWPVKFTARQIENGTGRIYVDGYVTGSFLETLNVVREFYISSHWPVPRKEDFTIDIDFRHPYPLAGNSYGLPLALALLGAHYRRTLPPTNIYTGTIQSDGSVTSVGGIDKKRMGAAANGYKQIWLPSSQVYPYCSTIDQVPVDTVVGAFKKLTTK